MEFGPTATLHLWCARRRNLGVRQLLPGERSVHDFSPNTGSDLYVRGVKSVTTQPLRRTQNAANVMTASHLPERDIMTSSSGRQWWTDSTVQLDVWGQIVSNTLTYPLLGIDWTNVDYPGMRCGRLKAATCWSTRTARCQLI